MKDAGRAGRWARENSRRAQLDFLKANRLWMSVFSVAVLAIAVGILAFWPSVPAALSVGVITASWFWMLAMITSQYSGASSKAMGANAEEWTSEELRKLEARGWHVFDAFPVNSANHDVDHLAIGPPGVFAIETKWSGSDWFSSEQRRHLSSCVRQAHRRAERFSRMRSGFSLKDRPIHPVLVVWGPATSKPADAEAFQVIDGVVVVRGPWIWRWVDSLGEVELSPETIERASFDLSRHIDRRDPHFLGEDPGRFVRGGGEAVISDTIRAAWSAMVSVFATMWVSAVLAGTSWTAFYVGSGALLTGSWIAWRNWRNPILLGWAVGATASAPIMASWWLAERVV